MYSLWRDNFYTGTHTKTNNYLLNKTMKKYRVEYVFDGEGYAIVKARNADSAENKFYGGDAEYHDGGQNYEVSEVHEVQLEPKREEVKDALVEDIKQYIKDFEATQPRNVTADTDTFEGWAYNILQRTLGRLNK
jgi:hypothetical protein